MLPRVRGGAAERAEQQVAAVRDDPAERVALAERTYGHLGQWARGEVAFMRWEVERGVLDPPSGERPGSAWWRAVNEGLLRDAVEGRLLADGERGPASTPAAAAWQAVLTDPSPQRWYAAHNRSIVAGYLAHAELAGAELPAEQRLMNLVLMRVLYAQALEDDLHLGLGPLAVLGRLLADPRACGVGDVVEVPDLYPRRYPLDGLEAAALEHRLPTPEDAFVALLDEAVVFPHLERLYDHAATTLHQPALTDLQLHGRPRYPAALLPPVDPASWVIASAPPVHHDLPWVCAQRWEQVLFLSWALPPEAVRPLVPDALELDLRDGHAYVSLLPLRMARVHLRDLPGMPELANFPELNLRAYVRHHGEPGVYFFSLDAPNALAVGIGRHVFHVRYDHARMSMRTDGDGTVRFRSHRRHVGADVTATFEASYRPTGPARPTEDGSIERFLCERYAMYGSHPDGTLVRGDIRHAPWLLRDVELELPDHGVVRAAGLPIDRPPDHVAYSDATDNVVWPMVRV